MTTSNQPPPLPTKPPPVPRRTKGFSLASLILLVTASAAACGLVAATLAADDRANFVQVVLNASAGALLGTFLGGFLASSYQFGVAGVVQGVWGGFLAGAGAGALSGCNANLPIALAGAAVLIATAAAFHFLARHPNAAPSHPPPPDDAPPPPPRKPSNPWGD